ncbi:hypothetical protein BN137_2357 [Cronobacter condimenti 1330]|uniref:Uncharacterized protein n=1 Tax=Cronobacter condimenti 1330 TaxID=1073999 RepID=K8A0Y8_9ENTR|nr:hypothetical protein BN137_2357 [Cronobacter condimenti 1330]
MTFKNRRPGLRFFSLSKGVINHDAVMPKAVTAVSMGTCLAANRAHKKASRGWLFH